jgi:hypothetical protein
MFSGMDEEVMKGCTMCEESFRDVNKQFSSEHLSNLFLANMKLNDDGKRK